MSPVSYKTYLDFIQSILGVWKFWGDDFKVHTHDKQWVEGLRDSYAATLDEIAGVEERLKVLKAERDRQVKEISGFGVLLRRALVATFAAGSTQLTVMPNLRAKRPGRPTKRAVTLKANNARRRAEKAAAEAEQRTLGEGEG